MLRQIANRAVFCAGLGLVSPLFGVAQVRAADCPEPNPIRVCTEFFHSDIILTGKLISMRQWPQPPDPNNLEGWFYKIQVQNVYRGQTPKNFEVYTGNDPTEFPMKVGNSYLLFLQKTNEGRYAPYNCGNSAELADSGDKIKQLEKVIADVKAGEKGSIGGRVAMAEPGSRTLSKKIPLGVVVTATNAEGSYRSVSDTQGNFDIPVPPGTYALTGQSLKKAMEGDDVNDVIPYPLSYMNPAKVAIDAGGCADVQLLAEPKDDVDLNSLLPPLPPLPTK